MSQSNLEREFYTAIRSAGNEDSTFETYWPIVLDFISTTRKHRGRLIDRSSINVDDIYYFRDQLSTTRRLSPRSVNQAMSAIRFLFERVLHREIEQRPTDKLRLKQPTRQRRRMITMPEIKAVCHELSPIDHLLALMMYGCLSRLDDILNVRIKDINFAAEQLEISDCKHDHFRVVPLPTSLHSAIQQQIARVQSIHCADMNAGRSGVPVPDSFATKCPTAPKSVSWYWLFPSRSLSLPPNQKTGPKLRFHIDADAYRKRFTAAVRATGLHRRITCHDFRRAGATHYYQATKDIERLQEMLGHNSVEQTKDYIFESDIKINGNDSPLDQMLAS